MNKELFNTQDIDINLEKLKFDKIKNDKQDIDITKEIKKVENELKDFVKKVSGDSIKSISYITLIISISLSMIVAISLLVKFEEGKGDLGEIIAIISIVFIFGMLSFFVLVSGIYFLFIRIKDKNFYIKKMILIKTKDEFKKFKRERRTKK